MSLKKLLVFCFVVLLLCGCGANPEENTVPVPLETQPETSTTYFYEHNSDIEKATRGAVRTYMLDQEYTGMIPVGNMLMIVSKDGRFVLLQGDEGQVVASAQTDISAAWGAEDLFVGSQNIGYYAADSRETVILDHALQEIYRIPMPEDMQGKPIIQLDKGELFYCTTGQIRAIQVQSGISRMVRTHACMSQELLGSYFGDAVIGCRIVDEQGEEYVLYLDAKTGQELSRDGDQRKLCTHGQWYYAQGNGQLFGCNRQERKELAVSEGLLIPVLQAQGVIQTKTNAEGLQLSFYDLSAGTRSAEVTVPGLETDKIAATEDGYVWALSGETLYRWDTAKSPTKESAVYTSVVYSPQMPDAEGLNRCAETAARLEQTYGVTLKIYEDAAQAGAGFRAVAEYRVPETEEVLTQLESLLMKLPENFMTLTGDVRVYLVQSLEGEADRALCWEDGTCHMFITAQNAPEAFLWGLGNAVDTRVLGNSFDYDQWDKLNPWWFDYTYDYEENLNRDDPDQYLEGDNRYFTDITAMSFPTEDRSRLFANGMMEDNADMFASSTMQKKLHSICVAIREAYGWEDSTEIYPWEQYLDTPLGGE